MGGAGGLCCAQPTTYRQHQSLGPGWSKFGWIIVNNNKNNLTIVCVDNLSGPTLPQEQMQVSSANATNESRDGTVTKQLWIQGTS